MRIADVTQRLRRSHEGPDVPPGRRALDFVVIGAMKAGTTSLWQYMATHPDVFIPGNKEAPYYTSAQASEKGLDWYFTTHFKGAPAHAKWGTATPPYMQGTTDATPEEVASRLHADMPDAKLIALLRDPIERAISQYTHMLRKGFENRDPNEVFRAMLQEPALKAARKKPKGTNSYIVGGEYGRVLTAYYKAFGPEQILVRLTTDLAHNPRETVAEIFEFIGVDPKHVPPNLDERYHKGGTKRRVSPDAIHSLKAYMDTNVWPRVTRQRAATRRAFDFWLETIWNLVGEDVEITLDPQLRALLDKHYRQDAEILTKLIGRPVPWGPGRIR